MEPERVRGWLTGWGSINYGWAHFIHASFCLTNFKFSQISNFSCSWHIKKNNVGIHISYLNLTEAQAHRAGNEDRMWRGAHSMRELSRVKGAMGKQGRRHLNDEVTLQMRRRRLLKDGKRETKAGLNNARPLGHNLCYVRRSIPLSPYSLVWRVFRLTVRPSGWMMNTRKKRAKRVICSPAELNPANEGRSEHP